MLSRLAKLLCKSDWCVNAAVGVLRPLGWPGTSAVLTGRIGRDCCRGDCGSGLCRQLRLPSAGAWPSSPRFDCAWRKQPQSVSTKFEPRPESVSANSSAGPHPGPLPQGEGAVWRRQWPVLSRSRPSPPNSQRRSKSDGLERELGAASRSRDDRLAKTIGNSTG